jgi:2-iminobutanoate/2-iminopropanoate deaminase
MTTPTGKPLPPRGGPYSLSRTTSSGLVFVAGQTAVDPSTARLVDGGITEQTLQVLDNIASILATEGCTLGDVVKVSVFLADLGDFAAMNQAYESRFQAPYPVRTTVEVGLSKGLLIEVDAVASKPMD